MASDDELDQLLQQNTTQPTSDQRFTYLATAIATVAVPVYLYQTIFAFPVEEKFLVYAVVSLLSAFILTFAYHNVAYSTKNRLIAARETNITIAKVTAEAQAKGENKKDYVKKKKEEILAVTTKESIAYSILFNNVYFLLSTVFLAFYVFGNYPSAYNYVLSVSLSAGLISFSSASQV